MKIAAKTDIGNQRSENQDGYRAGSLPDGTVWAVVCDGMGGARGGRLASSLAVDALEAVFGAGAPGLETAEQARALLEQALSEANARVYEKARGTPALSGMGTTAVCALLRAGRLFYAHVGDSRAYLFRNNTLLQLTRDHSMVQEMVEQGALTQEQAQNHPRRNLITRALGVGPEVTADVGEKEVSPRDIVMLCTDGLSNYVPVAEIESVLAQTPFFETADALVDKALQAGGTDNITVLLAQTDAAEGNNG